MANEVNFDPGTQVVLGPHTVSVMAEVYDLGSVAKTQEYELSTQVLVDAVSGNLSLNGLNISWWKRLLRWFGFYGGRNTAICGWIGSGSENYLAFDFQGLDSNPLNKEVFAVFPGGVPLDKVRFTLYPDLALPTDFRAALVFHRLA